MNLTAEIYSPQELTDAPSLADAYGVCRKIARREAKNFYYAFRALPEPKRNGICAVYAFMRHADDLTDDDSQPPAARSEHLRAWLQAWHSAVQGGATTNPVFIALADASRRYNIPLELLEKLVQGTAMDLYTTQDAQRAAKAEHVAETFATFDDLYRYCYLVASVVGLVCIRIFGYTDPAAEKLAEELGIAFQLTNILRDVREDAERARIYLPLEDLASYNVSPALLNASARAAHHGLVAPELRRLLAFESTRAEHYYAAGRRLMPMISPDSRPALWVLITIYHRLLRRIAGANYDVFSTRITVPTREKIAILGVGLLGMARVRLIGR